MITPEARPFAKTGGLADVAGALPQALARLGHRVTLVLPRYRGVDTTGFSSTPVDVPFGPQRYPVAFLEKGDSPPSGGTGVWKGDSPPSAGTGAWKGDSPPSAGTGARKGDSPPSAGTGGRKGDCPPSEGRVTAVLVDAPDLFDRDGLYGTAAGDFPDNGFRFAVLSRAALEYARVRGQRPSVVHGHDW